MTADFDVLVLGENALPWHQLADKQDAFREILDPIATVEITTDRDRLGSLDGRDVVVDFLSNSTLTSAQLTSLLSFVEDGGGYVGVHPAADLHTISREDGDLLRRPEPVPELRDLLGGHFLTHPEQADFGVTIEQEHPVTDGVSAFTVFDEPYQVEWDDDVTVLARMDHPDLDAYPVVWVKAYGDGRVCYLSLGHTDEAFATAAFQALLRNAIEWSANRD